MHVRRLAGAVLASLAVFLASVVPPAGPAAEAANAMAHISGSTIVYTSAGNTFDTVTVNGFSVNYRFTSDGP